jgi:calcineurin-like phosphoesterase family protein
MSQAKVFVISDTHFGHRNIIKFEEEKRRLPSGEPFRSIEEHDRYLVEQWNSVVREKDTVWHLGDVYFGKGADILGALKGYKRLVLGNHDAKKEEFLIQYFDRIYGVAEFGDCILSHIPVHPYQLERRYAKNIHGHMHSKRVQKSVGNGAWEDDPRYVCVSVEQTDLKPVLLQTVIQQGLH